MIAACLKWVDKRPEFDASGEVTGPDARFTGMSAADHAALEWALRCRDAWKGSQPDEVVAFTVGPPAADGILREALAAGAARAVRIDLPFASPSRVVASNLAALLAEARFVWCGDYSADRGTGSVPAFVAADLGFAQALGLIDIFVRGAHDSGGLRRLDGGRRERLAFDGPTVISVEGSSATLRRASLRALVSPVEIEVVPGLPSPTFEAPPTTSRPYRPRPRVLAAPAGNTALDRIRAITSSGADLTHGETVTLDPAAAADRILEALQGWGYRAQ